MLDKYRAGLLLLVVSLLAACGEQAKQSTDEMDNIVRPAKLAQVGASNNNDALNFPAVIQAKKSSLLSFQVSGIITNLAVTDGMEVKQGQLLGQLDTRDYKTKLAQAQAQFENADVEYKRALSLSDKGAISKRDLAKLKADFEVKQSLLSSAKKALDDTSLHAPFSGHIAKVMRENQEFVTSSVEVFSLLSLNELEAKIDLPSKIIIHSKDAKGSDLEAYVILDAAPEYRIKATFKEAALEADQQLQTYEVIFGFDAIDELVILPGMSAKVLFNNIVSSEGSNEIKVPLNAIGNDGQRTFVWVVDPKTMAVHKRFVVLDAGVGQELGVLSGLSLNETIVVAGIDGLVEGAVVRPWVK